MTSDDALADLERERRILDALSRVCGDPSLVVHQRLSRGVRGIAVSRGVDCSSVSVWYSSSRHSRDGRKWAVFTSTDSTGRTHILPNALQHTQMWGSLCGELPVAVVGGGGEGPAVADGPDDAVAARVRSDGVVREPDGHGGGVAAAATSSVAVVLT